MSGEAQVPRKRLFAYALPGIVLAIPTLPVAIYLPALYGAELGMAAAGLALLLARTADVITDPLVGVLSDTWRAKWGRRKPWIAAGALLGGLALIQLFQPPPDVTFTYLTVWSLLLYFGWTMISVPYSAWGAEMSADTHQRTRITSAREGAMLVGILLAGVLPAVVTGFGLTERDALRIASVLAVVIGAPLILWMLIAVPDPLPQLADSRSQRASPWTRRRLIEEGKVLAANAPFRTLIIAWFINGIANGIPAALFLLYLEHRLEAGPAARSALIVMYFLCAILMMPVWVALSRRYGRHRVWCWAMIATCAAFIWVPLLGPGDIILFGVVCAVTGFGLGADLALPPALQADVVDLDVERSGRNRAGLLFSLWGMASKFALAAAVGITFPVLGFFGFEARGPSPQGIVALAVVYSLVPVGLKLFAIAVMWNFPEHIAKRDPTSHPACNE